MIYIIVLFDLYRSFFVCAWHHIYGFICMYVKYLERKACVGCVNQAGAQSINHVATIWASDHSV